MSTDGDAFFEARTLAHPGDDGSFLKGYLAGLERARDHLASSAAATSSLEEHGLSEHPASAHLAYEMSLLSEEIVAVAKAAKEEMA